ncbi:patatin-like phospholipase family protein [Aquirufa antheringensis]|uniref:patatin-like phospholipase family protein n=1 Tax=Aquirufa antheringensis TaxID=2516559 RepID=UPI00103292FF|nr:patatin-like phospholipase family protein [Aquirufa antheringensis]MCE4216033.1 patatin [Pseudarcicella sp. GAP-15]MCZ2485490.1 patatin [Aquirufa antheringensis]TBH70377.1 patatin [Aquirufa antheringensis]
MSQILVLAGGSVKGAFQAGVIKALFEKGYQPDAIYGVSAGSLNAAYLVNQFGQQANSGTPISYPQAAQDLWDFWELRITCPDCLSKPFNIFQLGWTALTKKFKGLVDTSPLRNLLSEVLEDRNLQASPVGLKVGAVNIMEGSMHYVDPSFENFQDYLMASSAVPILMPVVQIQSEKRKSYLDGGLRDVAPLQKAINDGAKEIVVIACHTEMIEGGDFDSGDLLALVDRVMDIAVNEILNADLRMQRSEVKLTIIRPKQPLSIDIQRFTKMDIRRMLETGYALGLEL